MKQNCPDFQKAEELIISKLDTELSPTLFYHNKAHTLDVLQMAMEISNAECVSIDDQKLLRIAALFHDSGFLYVYQDHEAKGCELAAQWLVDFGFSVEQIDIICNMIMATRIPQKPKTKLEMIIADADLDYLGRRSAEVNAQKLFDELKIHNVLKDVEEWIPFQINFLKQHHYFTNYSKKFRDPNKKQYLDRLISADINGL